MAHISGFHYKGKDKRGVSQWKGSGDWARVLRVLGVGFMIYGVGAACVFIALLLFALLTHTWPVAFHVLVLVSGIHALTFGGTGWWMRNLQKHIDSLNTPDQLAARFGVNPETLAAVAQDKDIKPRMSINGMDYYNPADFAADAFTLLRGVARPDETQDVLLRPAGADTQSSPDQLLRIPTTGDDFAALDAIPTDISFSSPVAPTHSNTSAEAPMQEIRRR